MTFEKIDDSDYIIDIGDNKSGSGFTIELIKIKNGALVDLNLTARYKENDVKMISFIKSQQDNLNAKDIKTLIEDGIKYRKINETKKSNEDETNQV